LSDFVNRPTLSQVPNRLRHTLSS